MNVDDPQSQFYLLEPTGMAGCGLVSYTIDVARKSWLCPRCGAVRHHRPIDVRLDDDPPKQALNFICGTFLGIMSREFRDALGEQLLDRYFHVGSVSFRGTINSADWFTFHGKHKLIVRRVERVIARTCEVCGRCMYYGMGRPHLFPEPPASVEIFHSGIAELVITAAVKERLMSRNWKNLAITKLEIPNRLLDGHQQLGAAGAIR